MKGKMVSLANERTVLSVSTQKVHSPQSDTPDCAAFHSAIIGR